MDYLYNSIIVVCLPCYNHAVLFSSSLLLLHLSLCVIAIAGEHLFLEVDMVAHTLSLEVYTVEVGQNIVVGFGDTMVVLVVCGVVAAVVGLPELL